MRPKAEQARDRPRRCFSTRVTSATKHSKLSFNHRDWHAGSSQWRSDEAVEALKQPLGNGITHQCVDSTSDPTRFAIAA